MPGAGKQPAHVQEHIKELLEAGFDPTTIHRRLKVGRSSIYRMKRCLQQHGTAYMPSEMNKKNGRPKVLTADQELEVRDWLKTPANRDRYLDDLVWLIHDRFGIVCSTTTMSKMKRKWLRVLEYEERGRPIDLATRDALLETHPHLPILQDPDAIALPGEDTTPGADVPDFSMPPPPQLQHPSETDPSLLDTPASDPSYDEPNPAYADSNPNPTYDDPTADYATGSPYAPSRYEDLSPRHPYPHDLPPHHQPISPTQQQQQNLPDFLTDPGPFHPDAQFAQRQAEAAMRAQQQQQYAPLQLEPQIEPALQRQIRTEIGGLEVVGR